MHRPRPREPGSRRFRFRLQQYLAARTRTTSHLLVTKTTQQLIDEALGTPAPAATSAIELPGWLLRLLPDWGLSIPAVRYRHGNRPVTVTEHLELTALVIERYGWTQGKHRTRSGRACILDAQAVLFRLGIGDQSTVDRAGQRLQAVLNDRGCTLAYHRWNMPDPHGRRGHRPRAGGGPDGDHPVRDSRGKPNKPISTPRYRAARAPAVDAAATALMLLGIPDQVIDQIMVGRQARPRGCAPGTCTCPTPR